jgi:hypothetical protein
MMVVIVLKVKIHVVLVSVLVVNPMMIDPVIVMHLVNVMMVI